MCVPNKATLRYRWFVEKSLQIEDILFASSSLLIGSRSFSRAKVKFMLPITRLQRTHAQFGGTFKGLDVVVVIYGFHCTELPVLW